MTDLPIPSNHRRFRVDSKGVAWFAGESLVGLIWTRIEELKPGTVGREECAEAAEHAFLWEAERQREDYEKLMKSDIERQRFVVIGSALCKNEVIAFANALVWRRWGEEK